MSVKRATKRAKPVSYGLEILAGVLVAIVVALVQPARASEAPLDTAMDAVFTVRSADAEDRFLGSAFLWGKDGQVAVTNAHVVGEADEVRLIDRQGHAETATVIAHDAVRDVAVISAAPGRRGLTPAEGAEALGAEVFAMGAPLGIEFTLTEGRISATARQVDVAVPIRMLQHDAAVNPGSSGGPLVDGAGRLLGMNSQIADGSRMFVGIAYAIPAGDLNRIVTGLIDETLLPFPKLAMTARPVDRQLAEALGVAVAGLLIDGTEAGGLAAIGGLKAGDILLAVNETALTLPGDFAFAIEAAVPAGTANLTILRGRDTVVVLLPLVAATDTDTPAIGIKARDLRGLGKVPERVTSYSLAALGLELGAKGVVADVTDNSPALFAGLAKGDRIVAVNGTPMDLATLQMLQVSAPVLMLLEAPGGATRHIYLNPWGATEGVHPIGGANVLDPDVVVF